jgi:hypothetical protein
MSQDADIFKTALSAPPADSPFSNDPLFKVSQGRPPRSNHIRDCGVSLREAFFLTYTWNSDIRIEKKAKILKKV